MSTELYLAIMLGIIGLMLVLVVPVLFWKKCSHCGVRNFVDVQLCKACRRPFTDTEATNAGAHLREPGAATETRKASHRGDD
ncbi:MAG: hypothetical protein WD873_01875 [Candidatus Hydrogenedentales bacterium]